MLPAPASRAAAADAHTAPTVTIITPSYNQAAFLPATLASIAAQTYPAIEHLVRDGGSTDGSADILARFQPAPAHRFHWRSEPDGGQAAAINAAIGDARGSIIAWVNSDDLLMPDAVARAVAHFQANPNHLMVYGRARWVDADGNPLDWYPTQPPDGPLDRFRDGCFLCQPTVFLRREVFAAVGLLDASLYASHDFDLWIRLFKAAPGRIGFLDADLARSRLHTATKTLAAWDRAAIESMRVIRRHFGDVPPHWLLTAATDCMERHPLDTGATGRGRVLRLLRQALPLLTPEAVDAVKRHLRADRRFTAAGPGVAVTVSPDGWAGRRTAIRVRRDGARTLILHGRHAHPKGAPERLSLWAGRTPLASLSLERNGPFTWRIPLPPPLAPGSLERFDLVADTAFVPAALEEGSTDQRALSVLIDAAALA